MKKKEFEEGLYKRENGVAEMTSAEKKQQEQYCSVYMKFLGAAKTERLAYAAAVKLVESAGFRPLGSFSRLKPGDKVYRGYHAKTLMAAVIGQRPVAEGVRVVGGHTDAPRIDLKPVPVAEMDGIAFFDTHYYGGLKKFQWVTRPLALYGTVIRADGTSVDIAIGDKPDDPVFMITDVLPHFGYDQEKKPLKEAFPAESLDLLVATTPCPNDKDNPDMKTRVRLNVLRILEKEYGISEKDFVSGELEIVPAGMPRELGLDRSMIIGYGHDDRVCAFAGLKALIDTNGIPENTGVVLLCDKEEIGSVGASGMDSTFFENSVAEMIYRQEKNYSDILVRRSLEASMMLSADVCAASDPHFKDADSPNNMAKLNAGPCMIKYTGAGGKSGASDARAEFIGRLRTVLDKSGVVWQAGELGQAEKGGGGTISKFMARYGMDVVDFGTPLLNMHAPCEAASKFDIYMTYKAYAAFFNAAKI